MRMLMAMQSGMSIASSPRRLRRITTLMRMFPHHARPRMYKIAHLSGNCFIVKDSAGQKLAYACCNLEQNGKQREGRQMAALQVGDSGKETSRASTIITKAP
jgi:hypothetical protein